MAAVGAWRMTRAGNRRGSDRPDSLRHTLLGARAGGCDRHSVYFGCSWLMFHLVSVAWLLPEWPLLFAGGAVV